MGAMRDASIGVAEWPFGLDIDKNSAGLLPNPAAACALKCRPKRCRLRTQGIVEGVPGIRIHGQFHVMTCRLQSLDVSLADGSGTIIVELAVKDSNRPARDFRVTNERGHAIGVERQMRHKVYPGLIPHRLEPLE